MMNKRIKQRWVEALKSGVYAKGSKVLRSDAGWCCLGVLTDLWVQEINQQRKAQNEVLMEWELLSDADGYYTLGFTTTYLEKDVFEWSGLSRDVEERLVALNDTNFDFEPVIQYIEDEL